MEIRAMAAHERGGPLSPFRYDAGALGDHEVLVKVIACGLCASDISMMSRAPRLPMVPGHEVVGEVLEAGRAVRRLKAGDRVGVGWQSGACLECHDCLVGRENLCDQSEALIMHAYGGFADHLKVDARFAFALPGGLAAKHAGPLMCAGATVYAALRHAGMTSGRRVGVVGVGGLGHLAIQYASKLSNHVVAFTGSHDKAEFAARLGAREAVVVPRGGAVPGQGRKLDVILVTSSETLDWGSYLNQLDADGTIVTVALPHEPMAIPAIPLVLKRRRLMASLIGSRAEVAEAVELADRLGVEPIVETFALAEANEAVRRVKANEVRYRAVLEV
ncbi:MAG TPA: NAD(P)-dependent alcohol dehydrogenase [Polyangiaceae bacterium]|nr:NAD(P)-dependent alcohol dehydrogenase [Polyangiaceae bacterium]